ncbi:hypothetical protein GTA08_BOTSDO10810 [Botryosphaeria dothidea]|uniref:Uncharacterized protein n=1 Tax=Botryosphaeria dothidea TaxID=55169 RepID=A0A8H4MWG5_9PEZI|nr:hypothetical protein GTA08_BOTSDO10810 [Botryosphaeria dothidea]
MNYTGLSRAIRQPWFMNIEKEIFKRAKQNHDVLSAWSSQYWYEATFPFLASMTPGVLLELVEGNLAEEQLRNLDPDQPLHRPLQYFGWAADLGQRLNQYKRHQSSNEMMDLFHAVLMNIFDVSSTQRRGLTLHMIPLCFLTKLRESVVAEILFTVLGGGYPPFEFNSKPTGLNNQSADHINQRKWDKNTVFAINNTPYCNNMKTETAMHKAEIA